MEQDANAVTPTAENVTPVTETPAPVAEKRKNSNGNGWKVATVVATVAAICGVGFGAYGMVQNNQNQAKTTSNNNTSNTNEAPAENVAADDDEVKELVNQISSVVDEYMGNIHFRKTYNEFLPSWKMAGTDIFINMEKSYGIDSGVWSHNKETEAKLFTVHEPVEAFLVKNGYVRKEGTSTLPVYYNEKTEIICELSESSSPWDMGCAKTNWYSAESAELATELAEISGSDYVGLTSAKIKDSSVSPYQTLIASGHNAAMLFYRKSPNDKWEYLTTTQAAVDCDLYNEDAKKAFAGDSCWDTKTESLKTL